MLFWWHRAPCLRRLLHPRFPLKPLPLGLLAVDVPKKRRPVGLKVGTYNVFVYLDDVYFESYINDRMYVLL